MSPVVGLHSSSFLLFLLYERLFSCVASHEDQIKLSYFSTGGCPTPISSGVGSQVSSQTNIFKKKLKWKDFIYKSTTMTQQKNIKKLN